MTTTTDGYLAQVLAHLPTTTPARDQIALELRGHIEERLAHGQPLDAILRQLGDPAALARSYLAEVPLAPAEYGARLVAKVIDLGLVFALAGVLLLLAWINPRRGFFDVWVILAVLVAGFGYLVYTVVAEWRSGQTIGKRRFGLHVVQENGAPITFGQAVVRQLAIVLQIFWIDAMFVLFTQHRQRAFELLSKTRVVQPGRGGGDR